MDDTTMQERYRALLLAARNLFSLTRNEKGGRHEWLSGDR